MEKRLCNQCGKMSVIMFSAITNNEDIVIPPICNNCVKIRIPKYKELSDKHNKLYKKVIDEIEKLEFDTSSTLNSIPIFDTGYFVIIIKEGRFYSQQIKKVKQIINDIYNEYNVNIVYKRKLIDDKYKCIKFYIVYQKTSDYNDE